MPNLIKLQIFLFAVLIISYTNSNAKEILLENDSLEIIGLENGYSKALIAKDGSYFEKLLHRDFIYTENDAVYTRDDVMKSLLSTGDIVESSYNEDMQVYMFGNTAIVTGLLYVNGSSADGKYKRKYRFTDVWQKSDNAWQIIAAQDYLMP